MLRPPCLPPADVLQATISHLYGQMEAALGKPLLLSQLPSLEEGSGAMGAHGGAGVGAAGEGGKRKAVTEDDKVKRQQQEPQQKPQQRQGARGAVLPGGAGAGGRGRRGAKRKSGVGAGEEAEGEEGAAGEQQEEYDGRQKEEEEDEGERENAGGKASQARRRGVVSRGGGAGAPQRGMQRPAAARGPKAGGVAAVAEQDGPVSAANDGETQGAAGVAGTAPLVALSAAEDGALLLQQHQLVALEARGDSVAAAGKEVGVEAADGDDAPASGVAEPEVFGGGKAGGSRQQGQAGSRRRLGLARGRGGGAGRGVRADGNGETKAGGEGRAAPGAAARAAAGLAAVPRGKVEADRAGGDVADGAPPAEAGAAAGAGGRGPGAGMAAEAGAAGDGGAGLGAPESVGPVQGRRLFSFLDPDGEDKVRTGRIKRDGLDWGRGSGHMGGATRCHGNRNVCRGLGGTIHAPWTP